MEKWVQGPLPDGGVAAVEQSAEYVLGWRPARSGTTYYQEKGYGTLWGTKYPNDAHRFASVAELVEWLLKLARQDRGFNVEGFIILKVTKKLTVTETLEEL